MMSMVKVVRKTPIDKQERDVTYWRTQPYEARLAALEQIRREYHQWQYGTEPGFQRVYTIIKR